MAKPEEGLKMTFAELVVGNEKIEVYRTKIKEGNHTWWAVTDSPQTTTQRYKDKVKPA